MALFKNAGKSGVTGSKVQATVNKHKYTGPVNEKLARYSRAPNNGAGCKTPKMPPMVGEPNSSYAPKSVKL